MYKLDLEKAEEQRSNCQHPLDHRESKGILENIYFCFIDYAKKPLTVWITTNFEKFLKKWEYHPTLPASWKTCVQVKKHS